MTRSYNDWERSIDRRPIRNTFFAGFWIIAIIVGLSAVGGVGFWAINLASQPGRVITQTFDANNMVHNYEWFRQQHADIEAMGPQIGAVESELTFLVSSAGDRSSWSRTTETQFNQLNSQLTGLKNKRTRMIQDYNARGAMANRSIFQAGLPQQLPIQ